MAFLLKRPDSPTYITGVKRTGCYGLCSKAFLDFAKRYESKDDAQKDAERIQSKRFFPIYPDDQGWKVVKERSKRKKR